MLKRSAIWRISGVARRLVNRKLKEGAEAASGYTHFPAENVLSGALVRWETMDRAAGAIKLYAAACP